MTFQPGFDQTKNWFLPVSGFDNNGNLLSDVSHSYSWDAENKLTAVDTVNLTFDALGRMVEQARGSSYTQNIYAPTRYKLALMNGQTLQKAFCSLPGGATAVYGSSGTIAYYRHADWLSSSRFASTPSRTKYFDVAYAPYGEDYVDSGTTDLNFTGQNQDTVSGLYDFLYREYHANSGRWIQPDPAGLGAVSMGNPQTWNRYAYVANYPLSAVDPLGLTIGRGYDVIGSARRAGLSYSSAYDPFSFFPGALSTASQNSSTSPQRVASYDYQYVPGSVTTVDDGAGNLTVFQTTGGWQLIGETLADSDPVLLAENSAPQNIIAANNVQSRVRLEQIANHLKKCGGVYPLVAASAGNFQIGSPPGNYAVTGPTDNPNNGFNGGNSTTTIDANNFANADPTTQTGVVVHEWFHQMQINNSFLFRFRVFFNRKSVEAEANAAAAEALQKCGPG